MDALLLLHPIHKVIGREPSDRGDYFVEATANPPSRQRPARAVSLRQRLGVRLAAVAQFARRSVLAAEIWIHAEAERRLFGVVHDGDWFHVGTPEAWPKPSGAQMKGVFSIGIDRRFVDELAAGALANTAMIRWRWPTS